MKKILFFASIASLLFVACKKVDEVKESEVVPEPTPVVVEQVTLNATVEELDDSEVKTDYTISGSTATFKWSGTEVFGKLVRASADGTTFSTYSKIDYTSTTELSTATGEFTGAAIGDGYYDTELALYPVNKSNGANLAFPTDGNIFTLTLQETLTYDKDNPLKDIVPMVGKIDEGNYTFKPLTGVLAIKATNIPTNANKITISSTGKALSGTTRTITGITEATYKTSLISQLYDADAGLPMSWISGSATKSYSFSGLNPANTYTFYFPIPTGTLPDLTITFYKDNDALYTLRTSKSITITRGHIKPLPLITVPQYKVSVGGTSTAPSGTFYRQDATVFFTVSNSETLARNSYVSGMKYTHMSGFATPNSNTYNFVQAGVGKAGLDISTTGIKYLHYVVAPTTYKDKTCGEVVEGDIIKQGKIPFYYITATDAAAIEGTYDFTSLHAITINNRSAWVDMTLGNEAYVSNGYSDSHIKIVVSNDPTKGSIMMTDFMGFGSDGVTNDSFTEQKLITEVYHIWTPTGTYGDVSPIYGSFESKLITLFCEKTPLFILDGTSYYLRRTDNATNLQFSYSTSAGMATITFGSSYFPPCIVTTAQISAFDTRYKGDTCTILFDAPYYHYSGGNATPTASRTL